MTLHQVEYALTVLSFGAGQDSTTLLYKYIYNPNFRARYAPGRFLVVMSDTGDEHDETYEHVRYILSLCAQHDIEFHFLPAGGEFHSEKWPSLIEFHRRTSTIGSKAFPKTCTDNLKIQPIYRFLEQWLGDNYGVRVGRKKGFYEFEEGHGRVCVLLGIAGGEESRMAKTEKLPLWMQRTVDRVYPLIELGMDRQACQDYIKSIGHTVPLPSNCKRCPFMNEVELLWLYRFHPDKYTEWVELEQKKLAKNTHMGDRNLGVFGKRTLPEVLKIVLGKHGDWSNERLHDYKMSHGHCVKSKY